METEDAQPPIRRRLFWTGLGWLCLVLGVIGIALPVLPTTPFVLLAAFCFGKGSPRLRAWLTGHRRFGPMIEAWERTGGIPRRAKALACGMMSVTFLASAALGAALGVLVVQALLMGAGAAYVLTRPDA